MSVQLGKTTLRGLAAPALRCTRHRQIFEAATRHLLCRALARTLTLGAWGCLRAQKGCCA
eukprot:11410184-Heterocapsa_arctica.AAC.1